MPAMGGDRSKYCMALSRPCLRTIPRSARSTGPTYGWARPGSSWRRSLSRYWSSEELSDWLPNDPSRPTRLSAQARFSRSCLSRADSTLAVMQELTQVARVRRFRPQMRRSQSAVKICSSAESSSGSHWIRSRRGSTLLMPRRPTDECSPSTACRKTAMKRERKWYGSAPNVVSCPLREHLKVVRSLETDTKCKHPDCLIYSGIKQQLLNSTESTFN